MDQIEEVPLTKLSNRKRDASKKKTDEYIYKRFSAGMGALFVVIILLLVRIFYKCAIIDGVIIFSFVVSIGYLSLPVSYYILSYFLKKDHDDKQI